MSDVIKDLTDVLDWTSVADYVEDEGWPHAILLEMRNRGWVMVRKEALEALETPLPKRGPKRKKRGKMVDEPNPWDEVLVPKQQFLG
jgi:hypothetical protein